MVTKRNGTGEPPKETVGQRLARIRKERGITQAELARLLDTAQPVVSNYEKGNLRLNADVIPRLAEILDVSADELLGLAERKPTQLPKDKRLLRRLHQVDKLSKRDREAVLRTIDAFLSKSAAE